MIEVVFSNVTCSKELAAATFGAWNGLIDAFEAAGQLSNPKRVALVAKAAMHTLLVTSSPVILQASWACSYIQKLSTVLEVVVLGETIGC